MFLKISGVDHLSGATFSINHRGFTKKMLKTFGVTEKNSEGPFWCFRKFLVSNNFIHKGGVKNFEQNVFFCLTVPKKIRRKILWCF